MKAYRLSVNLKLGLVLFAVIIAVASILYTNRLAQSLREREQFLIEIWASAVAQIGQTQPVNPYEQEFIELQNLLRRLRRQGNPQGVPLTGDLERFEQALWWARSMPPLGESSLAARILAPVGNDSDQQPVFNFGIPAIVMDSTGRVPQIWRNVAIPDNLDLATLSPEEAAQAENDLVRRAETMSEYFDPIPIVQEFGPRRLVQYVHFGESRLVRELRFFPYVQLLFVSLFILAGYFGFSYVRRSEQSSLWVGMAKEAAHQLGTPLSSLMGWLELLRMKDLPETQQENALNEIEKDIDRLRRVAGRFSDIGSLPKLEVMPLAPVIDTTADYMRRRFPRYGKKVTLDVSVPNDVRVPLNAELFEWVIENLVKNALDAIESNEGRIEIMASPHDGKVRIDVRDTGKGIDRRQWKNVFRPGYSTKKRGWGLGLSLAKRIVEDYHGGALTLAQSRVGHGTTFRIELRAAAPPVASEPPQS